MGLTVWGEASPYHTSTEISYLAFARFSWNPNLTWDEFVRNDVAPLLGGEDAARRYVEMAEWLDANASPDSKELNRVRSEALSNAAGSAGEVSRRWLWLADQAARRSFDQATLPVGSPW